MLIRAALALSLLVNVLATPVFAEAGSPASQNVTSGPSEPPLPGPLFCTLTVAHACTEQACAKVDALGNLKLPGKLLIHFEHRMIASTNAEGFPHMSEISTLAGTATDHVLQGIDHAAGWIIHLDEKGSKLTMTVTSREKILSSFGTCRTAG